MNNADFKEEARNLQIKFKEEELHIPADRCPTRKMTRNGKVYEPKVRNLLFETDCKDPDGNYRIFFNGFRKEITFDIDNNNHSSSGQMVTNLLRSEHIPYNVFFPMKYDLEGTVALFNAILDENRIASIGTPMIEYKPLNESGDGKSLIGDGTAFDVYIPYTAINGNKGGLGIEVKYTEKEYALKKYDKEGNITKEYSETHDDNGIHLADNYLMPSKRSGWFNHEAICDIPFKDITRSTLHVVMNHYRQIWRNHLLGASMTLQPKESEKHLDEFISITVYPADNGHFSDKLWKNYESMLTDVGKTTLKHFTYEQLFPLMREHLRNVPGIDEWIDYLNRRYIIPEQ